MFIRRNKKLMATYVIRLIDNVFKSKEIVKVLVNFLF